jgi:hypothetical protein
MKDSFISEGEFWERYGEIMTKPKNISFKKTPPFSVGQIVRPSTYGIQKTLFRGKKMGMLGKVTKVDEYNCPTILWDGRKTPKSYHPDFIEGL